jgi:hypothetical protein
MSSRFAEDLIIPRRTNLPCHRIWRADLDFEKCGATSLAPRYACATSRILTLTEGSGEQIKPGDYVRFHGEPGRVDFVADPADDPNDWYVQEFGGVMVLEPKMFGSVFINAPISDDEDIEFVSRGS